MPDNDNYSCIPKEPLIKLQEKGNPPIIKYQMEHETDYYAKSYIPLNVERDCFKAEHRKASNIDEYERFAGKEIDEIILMLHQEFIDFTNGVAESNLKKVIPAQLQFSKTNKTKINELGITTK